MGKISEVPDAHETLREQVKQETKQELLCRECHLAVYVSMRSLSPAECDLFIRKGDQAMICKILQLAMKAEQGLGDFPIQTGRLPSFH
jgi:hypothetical protein